MTKIFEESPTLVKIFHQLDCLEVTHADFYIVRKILFVAVHDRTLN